MPLACWLLTWLEPSHSDAIHAVKTGAMVPFVVIAMGLPWVRQVRRGPSAGGSGIISGDVPTATPGARGRMGPVARVSCGGVPVGPPRDPPRPRLLGHPRPTRGLPAPGADERRRQALARGPAGSGQRRAPPAAGPHGALPNGLDLWMVVDSVDPDDRGAGWSSGWERSTIRPTSSASPT